MAFCSFLDDLLSLDLPHAVFPTKKQRNKIIDKLICATGLVRSIDCVYKESGWFK